MGWIQDQFKKRTEISGKALTETVFPDSSAQRSPEREAWSRLLRGLSQDVEEFQRLGGNCNLQPLSDVQCRISNPPASIAVVVTADLSARTVEYSYESDQKKTAVPEKGIFDTSSVGWRSGFIFGRPTAHVRAGPATRSGAAALSDAADRSGSHRTVDRGLTSTRWRRS